MNLSRIRSSIPPFHDFHIFCRFLFRPALQELKTEIAYEQYIVRELIAKWKPAKKPTRKFNVSAAEVQAIGPSRQPEPFSVAPQAAPSPIFPAEVMPQAPTYYYQPAMQQAMSGMNIVYQQAPMYPPPYTVIISQFINHVS